MRKVKVNLSIGLTGDRDDVIEVEDDATEDEIEQEVQMWASNYIEVSWKEQE